MSLFSKLFKQLFDDYEERKSLLQIILQRDSITSR